MGHGVGICRRSLGPAVTLLLIAVNIKSRITHTHTVLILALVPYDLGAEANNQTFFAVSHAAVEALADQWMTRKIGWYHCPK